MKMNDNGYVTIHKRYLKTYLAVKEKVLMIHIDSRCVSIDNSKKSRKMDWLIEIAKTQFFIHLISEIHQLD